MKSYISRVFAVYYYDGRRLLLLLLEQTNEKQTYNNLTVGFLFRLLRLFICLSHLSWSLYAFSRSFVLLENFHQFSSVFLLFFFSSLFFRWHIRPFMHCSSTDPLYRFRVVSKNIQVKLTKTTTTRTTTTTTNDDEHTQNKIMKRR